MASIPTQLRPQQALNPAYRKLKPYRGEIDTFKDGLIHLLEQINPKESEEFHKNAVSRFLQATWYQPDHYINTKGRTDLVIHNGSKAKTTVGVIMEVKSTTNATEMVTRENLNRKAFHELLLYFLRERITHGNKEIKHLVVTNIHEWFIFDASAFERFFAQNRKLVKDFQQFEEKRLSGTKTDFFYSEIAQPFLAELSEPIPFTWFDIRDYEKPLRNRDKEDDRKLIALYKLLSPHHLLKLPFANDSNNLDRGFYAELLHILGLKEVKESGKKLIDRKAPNERDPESLIENTIFKLESQDRLIHIDRPSLYGSNREEQLFNIALELVITWVNRVLFMKLLEAQLTNYHQGDRKYAFLSIEQIRDFDELERLFFSVLALKPEERPPIVKPFAHIPYLNSSLFDPTDLEQNALFISNLQDNLELPIMGRTVLKDTQGKKRQGKLNTLTYLFDFLDAYDFASEGAEDIQEENKTLINASVLGLIFEKINGYRDGSYFTPGFITQHMCREAIRRAVVRGFKIHLTPHSPLQPGEGMSARSGDRGEVKKVTTVAPHVPTKLLEYARQLRQEQTPAEELLWQLLRNRKLNNWKFRRQHPINKGFILDFYCAETRVGIELDGAPHNDPEQREYDELRTERLAELGIRIIRFWNREVLENTGQVLESIVAFSEKGENSTSPVAPNLPQNLTDVYNLINREVSVAEANQIINNLRICDPAVGSGHFLVSALNELIAIKSELKILADNNGKLLHHYDIRVVNDELIVTNQEGEFFEYHPKSSESQRVQETLFREKQTLIENCLFGVDINPNSVKICRLRLWIELLKHSYYKPDGALETLPNIDINIKQGNSIISRFDLDTDLKIALKKSKFSIEVYQAAVNGYRHATIKAEKRELLALTNKIKEDFRTEIGHKDPIYKRLSKVKGELDIMATQTQAFEMTVEEKKAFNQRVGKLSKELEKIEEQIETIEKSRIYDQAFEWRFEFPEVLDEEGRFTGFDVVIGNPPYIRQEELSPIKPYLKDHYTTYAGTADLYVYFVERGMQILKPGGEFAYILPNKWMRAGYGKAFRAFVKDRHIHAIIDFGDLPVFEEATTYPCLLFMQQASATDTFLAANVDTLDYPDGLPAYLEDHTITIRSDSLQPGGWVLVDKKVAALLEKIRSRGVPLGEYVKGKIYYGIKTGLNEAFVIDEATKDRLIAEDPHSAEIIKPFLAGRDIKRYKQPVADKWLILLKNGDTKKWFGKLPEEAAWEKLCKKYPSVTNWLKPFEGKAKKRYDQGQYWWELRACDYYEEFEKPKIIVPAIIKEPSSAYDTEACYSNDKTTIIPTDELWLLAVLNSPVTDFIIRHIASTKRGGYYEYKPVYISQIPVPKKGVGTKLKEELSRKVAHLLKTGEDLGIDEVVFEVYGIGEEEIGTITS